MAEGLLVLAGSERIVVVYNRMAEELLGLAAGRLRVGMRLTDAEPPPALLAVIDRRQHDVSAASQEYVVDAGAHGILRISVALLPPAAAGDRASTLVVLHDPRDLQRLQNMRREFVANVSHEVRTPLAAIRGCGATLLAGALDDPEQARRFVEVIDHQAERLGQLVDDLSQLAELEQGMVSLHRRPIAVAAAVDRAAGACREQARAGRVTLALSVAADTPAVDGDRELLEQALVRLIENAIRYTPPGGTVSVSAAPADAQADGSPSAEVRFAVVDSGAGIPSQDLPRLSERFYRVEKGRPRGRGGNGLGLAIVKHIVQAHGGAMQIDSTLAQGTSVTLLWPAATEPGARACLG